jgi:transcriptional regulator with XRE-family HTH domain
MKEPREEFLALRTRMGLTQSEASKRLGLGRSTIGVYESGHGNIKPERWQQLIEALLAGTPSRAYAARPPRLRAAPSPKPDVEVRPAQAVTFQPRAPIEQHYAPAPARRKPRVRTKTCPLPRGAVDENEACICGSPRKRHDALKFSCQDCRRGSSGCQYFRPATRFSGAA